MGTKALLSQEVIEEAENDADYLIESHGITKPSISIAKMIRQELPATEIYLLNDMPTSLKGCSWFSFEDGAKIFLNGWYSPTCQRYTLAHEFGHLLKFESGTHTTTLENLTPEAQFQERRANYCAGCLLMPRKLMRAYWDFYDSIDTIADVFRVSRQAMIIRLKQLKLLPYDVAEHLLLNYKQFSAPF